MKSKYSFTLTRILSFVLAVTLLFSSTCLLAAELYDGANVAFAKSADDSKQEKSFQSNDLTESDANFYLPNYDTEVITQTDLPKPKVETFGKHDASYYPSFTNQLSSADFTDAKKAEILAENTAILADVKEWYAAGTLKDKLKKHVSADGQFSNAAGNYDNAPRIEKVVSVNTKITARKRSLGVFAPAGEILTVTIDESLVNKGLTVSIGYPYNGECEIGEVTNRWYSDRMAKFYLEFKLTQTVTYVGSPLGGMVTLNGVGSMSNFDITVSGGVDMPDYKLGVSTKEDWKNILAAPGPYVWLLTPYQYFVMPKVEIADIEDPYNAMLWWHKASMISIYGMAREDTGHFYTPVISVFDSYVYIGEGVAKVWAFVTNAPKYWCHGMVDYDNLMSNGAWGAIHEYNHHHQSHSYNDGEWGVGGIDEVTNNVLNSVSYIMLTDVAATRSESNLLNGWGAVTDPYCNYKKFASTSASVTKYDDFDTSKLFGYVDLMHTFGADRFLEFLRAQYGYGVVEGYEGTNLTQDGYLKSQDGFALFTSLFYKTDFTDYFTKVWHFNLSKETVQKIKGFGFDEYFSINNLYSAGIKGIETGRVYNVNVGTTNVFKFDEYTLCSTDDYKLEKVSNPKHGKLVDNGDGTYSYTPGKNFTGDEIELTYKVTLNGKSYTRTLVVKLAANYRYIERTTYNADESHRGLTVQEAIEQLEKSDNVLSTGTASNFTSNTANGDNLTHFKASVVFPFSKDVTFIVFGDDKTLLTVDGQTAYTDKYVGNLAGAIAAENNKLTLSVKEGNPLQVEAYCFNTGGGGKLNVKYSIDGGETYQDIPSSYCYAYNASKKDIEKANEAETNVYPAFVDFRNKYLNNWYSNSIKYTPASAQCLDDEGNEVKTVKGADVNAMFDGTTSTGFHTAWQGTKTPYPHNYYFTFEEEAYFNRINFYFQNNGTKGYYSFGEYEIYTSDDGVNYTLLADGNNTETNFNVEFGQSVATKYVKIVVKSNASGQAFTNVTEVEFVQHLNLGEDYNVYSSKDEAFNLDSKWSAVSGSFLNTEGMHADKGKVSFYLTGTDLMLYSLNAESKIKIDGKTYVIKANDSAYAPSFVISGLTNKRHLVEIEGVDMTIDMIKTSGRISAGGHTNWAAFGVSVALGTALVGSGTACVVFELKSKKKEEVKSE